MQIEIRIQPVYGSAGVDGKFPGLAAYLRDNGYEKAVREETTLYGMVDVLERVDRDIQTPEAAKRPLRSYIKDLIRIRDLAREALLGRRLNDLDKLLYDLEDRFRDMEKEIL